LVGRDTGYRHRRCLASSLDRTLASPPGCFPQNGLSEPLAGETRRKAHGLDLSPDCSVGHIAGTSAEPGLEAGQVVHGTAPETLLDTYHAERHPVGARVLRNTTALTAIYRKDDRIDALREMVCELLQKDAPRKQYVAMASGLDIHYDLGEGHPLLGRKMPDLDLVTVEGPQRVFNLLHEGRPVLLNLGEPGGIEFAPWAGEPGKGDRRQVRWRLGASGSRGGYCCADSAGRIRSVGGRPETAGACRRTDYLVRTTPCAIAHRVPTLFSLESSGPRGGR